MIRVLCRCLAAAVALCFTSAAAAQFGTEFTYQGFLTRDGQPANGYFETEWVLKLNSQQVGQTQRGGINVQDGLFTRDLDFGMDPFSVSRANKEVQLWLSIEGGPPMLINFVHSAPWAVRSVVSDTADFAQVADVANRPWDVNESSIHYAGKVGIGPYATTPAAPLHIASTDYTKIILKGFEFGVDDSKITFQTNERGYHVGVFEETFSIGDDNSARFQIDPFGKVSLHGAVEMRDGSLTVLNENMTVRNGEFKVEDQNFNNRFSVNPAGGLRALGLQVIGGLEMRYDGVNIGWQGSSRKFKENIEPLDDDFSSVFGLSPVSYTAKGDEHKRRQIGYIAEEVHDAGLHELVIYGEGNEPLSVEYDRMPVYLLEVVREQRTRIADLEARVERFVELEARVTQSDEINRRLVDAVTSLEERLAELESRRARTDR